MRRLPHIPAAFACFLFAGNSGAHAMDILACDVMIGAQGFDLSAISALCDTAARALGARLITADELDAEIARAAAGSTVYHSLDARVVSATTITYRYAFGTAGEWQTDSETRYDDLRIDIMDSTLNEAAVSMLSESVRRLSGKP